MDMLLGYLNSGVSAVLPFVILLGLLIFVHELGHFLVAVWCGVRVETFSLGFGKKIFKYKRGDTTYCISLIPLGGYVKMFGDEIGAQLSEADRPFSFTHKPVWKRIAIVLAGPLMNFFFAVLIFGVIASVGEEVRSPRVGDISESSLAFQSGFRSGDLVKSIGAEKIKSFDHFQHLVNQSHGQSIKIDVQRENSDQISTVEVTPVLKPNPNLLSLDSLVGEVDGLTGVSRAPVVGVIYKSAAYEMGLRTGDRILKFNDKSVQYFRELENLILSSQNQNLSLLVERLNEQDKAETVALAGRISAVASAKAFGVESPDLYLAKVLDGTPAQKAGMKSGDRVIAIDSIQPNTWEDVLNKVKSYDQNGSLNFTLERQGNRMEISITPQMTSQMNPQGAEEKRFTVGIVPLVIGAAPELTKVVYSGLFSPIFRGFERTIDITAMTCVSFLRLVQNRISPKNVSGVLSIGVAAAETFKIGIVYFLQMMAVISVNLFVLNLLPIPVLDGGHLLFYTIEALKGAPLSMRKMEIAQQVGLFLLMSLMVFALFNDFSRVFGLW